MPSWSFSRLYFSSSICANFQGLFEILGQRLPVLQSLVKLHVLLFRLCTTGVDIEALTMVKERVSSACVGPTL